MIGEIIFHYKIFDKLSERVGKYLKKLCQICGKKISKNFKKFSIFKL